MTAATPDRAAVTEVQKNCKACGDLITVRLADHRRGWGNFCDKACAGAYKTGQRPGDVNAYHAKCQGGHGWAAERLAYFAATYPTGKPPLAPKIRTQIGRREKVRPIYHSPANCRECGEVINGPGLCWKCEGHAETMGAVEQGWDGHKVWGIS